MNLSGSRYNGQHNTNDFFNVSADLDVFEKADIRLVPVIVQIDRENLGNVAIGVETNVVYKNPKLAPLDLDPAVPLYFRI